MKYYRQTQGTQQKMTLEKMGYLCSGKSITISAVVSANTLKHLHVQIPKYKI